MGVHTFSYIHTHTQRYTLVHMYTQTLFQRTQGWFPAPAWRSTVPVSGDLEPSSSLYRHHTCTGCTDKHVDNTPIYI